MERFDILVRALMDMLTAGLPQRSPYRSDRFCLHHVAQLKVRLYGVGGLLQDFRRPNPELLPIPSIAGAVNSFLHRDLHLWSVELSTFSMDIGLRLRTHPAKVIDVPVSPMLRFQNILSLLDADETNLQFTQRTAVPPAHVPLLSGTEGPGGASPKRGAKHGEHSPTEVKRKATKTVCRAGTAGDCRWLNCQFEHPPRDGAGAETVGTSGENRRRQSRACNFLRLR